MEQVVIAGSLETVEVFENDIDLYLNQYCERRQIESMAKESQSVWNAALMYIQRYVFPDVKMLKLNHNIPGNSVVSSNYNIYDYSLVDEICNYYIYICMENEKEVSILGFSNLTGIPDSTIYDWGYNQRELSRAGSEICKKLQKYNEESLSNKLASGKANPVGVIAILNRRHGWASPYTADSNRQRREALTAADLPRLGKTENTDLSANDAQIVNDFQTLCKVNKGEAK